MTPEFEAALVALLASAETFAGDVLGCDVRAGSLLARVNKLRVEYQKVRPNVVTLNPGANYGWPNARQRLIELMWRPDLDPNHYLALGYAVAYLDAQQGLPPDK